MRAFWSRAAPSPGSRLARTAQAASGRRFKTSHSWRLRQSAQLARTGQTPEAEAWARTYALLYEAEARPLSLFEKSCQDNGEPGPLHTQLERLPLDLDWPAIEQAVGIDVDAQNMALHAPAYADTDVADYDDTANAPAPAPTTAPPDNDGDDDIWDTLRVGTPVQPWPAHTGRPARLMNLPPQSLWAPDSMHLTAMRRRYTWKKLALLEFSTALLINKLMQACHSPTQVHDAEPLSPDIAELAASSPDSLRLASRQIYNSIDLLRQTSLDSPDDDIDRACRHPPVPAIPSYTQDLDGDFHAVTRLLNDGIRHLLLLNTASPRPTSRKVAAAVAKICHNLVISSAAPDIGTFNLLLVGFKRWGRPDLIHKVISALLTSKIRPNEITLREMIRFYTAQDLPKEFSQFVAWMRGMDNALMLARPSISINEKSEDRLIRTQEDKVLQKVHPTPMVFDALVTGVLKFAGFDRALDIYYEMKADGWGLDVQGLTRLLSDCLRRRDWQGGTYIWQEINSIKDIALPQDMARAYEIMLSLSAVTDQTGAFNHLLSDVVKSGFDRKSVLHAALKAAGWMRQKRTTSAPAFVADNVMIAGSDHNANASTESLHDTMLRQLVPGDDQSTQEMLGNDLGVDMDPGLDFGPEPEKQPQADAAKEKWASWVEAEFGERPKDPQL